MILYSSFNLLILFKAFVFKKTFALNLFLVYHILKICKALHSFFSLNFIFFYLFLAKSFFKPILSKRKRFPRVIKIFEPSKGSNILF